MEHRFKIGQSNGGLMGDGFRSITDWLWCTITTNILADNDIYRIQGQQLAGVMYNVV